MEHMLARMFLLINKFHIMEKKMEPTQNVMCACSFDMRFTFVMTGCEGTTNDI